MVIRVEGAKMTANEILLKSRKNRLDGRGFQQICRLPLTDPDLAKVGDGTKLAGNGHDHHIRLGRVIETVAHYNGWALLESGLVRKGKRD